MVLQTYNDKTVRPSKLFVRTSVPYCLVNKDLTYRDTQKKNPSKWNLTLYATQTYAKYSN